MTCSEHHLKLGADGTGKCSKPMWDGYGMPAGFCDGVAYGEQEPGQERSGNWERGLFYPSYCPGLACYGHGGPRENQQEKAATAPIEEPAHA